METKCWIFTRQYTHLRNAIPILYGAKKGSPIMKIQSPFFQINQICLLRINFIESSVWGCRMPHRNAVAHVLSQSFFWF